MGLPRLGALLVVLAVLAAACDPATLPGDPGPDVAGEQPVPAEPAPGASPGDQQSPQQPPPDDGPGEPAPGDPPPGDSHPGPAPGTQPVPAEGADLGPVGEQCRTYLRSQVPALLVELAYQSGARPAGSAVEHLASRLTDVTRKPVEVVEHEIPGGPQTWSAEDLRAAAERHRRHYSDAQRSVMFGLSVRGQFSDGSILGVAHRASEFAIFPDRIGPLAALLGGRAAVERSVLTHEAGHLLCLINITYRSEIDHEDADHPHHSNDPASVMHWAIQTSAIAQLFSGPPPADFTANDRADLEGLRTGRY